MEQSHKKLIKKEIKKDVKNIAKKKAKKVVHKQLSKHPHFAAMSLFTRALLDPFSHRNVKIPDLSTDPSSCFSIIQRQTITVNANGVCGIVYGTSLSGTSPTFTPAGGLVPSLTGVTLPFTVGHILPTTATAASFYPAASTVTNLSLPQFNSGSSTVGQLFAHVRLVSFGCKILFTGAALNAQGKITLARCARNTLRVTNLAQANLNVAILQSLPDSIVASVPIHGGGVVNFKPSDFGSFDYTPVNASTATTTANLGNEIYIAVDGAVANQTFFVEAIFNYEGLPLTNQFSLLDTAPSQSDPVSMSIAANSVAVAPGAFVLPDAVKSEAIASSMSSEQLVHHDAPQEFNLTQELVNGMGNVASVVKAGKGLIDDVGPILESALAFLV